MDQKHDNIDKQLTTSKIDSLAIIKSGLVKRGLELSNETQKKRLRVLIGDDDCSMIGEVIGDYLKYDFSKDYAIKIDSLCYSEEILEQVKRGMVDILILIVNNIRSSTVSHNVFDRLTEGLNISSQIKSEYRRPIIVLSGWTEDRYVEKAKSASEFFFPLPVKLEELKEAFKKCLEMISFETSQTYQYLKDK